jgi:hypothetical protein
VLWRYGQHILAIPCRDIFFQRAQVLKMDEDTSAHWLIMCLYVMWLSMVTLTCFSNGGDRIISDESDGKRSLDAICLEGTTCTSVLVCVNLEMMLSHPGLNWPQEKLHLTDCKCGLLDFKTDIQIVIFSIHAVLDIVLSEMGPHGFCIYDKQNRTEDGFLGNCAAQLSVIRLLPL